MNSFAFLAYPKEISQDGVRSPLLPALQRLPEAAYGYALRMLSFRPVVTGQLHTAQHGIQGHVIGVPITAHHLRTLPREGVQMKIQEAITCARDLGASMVGLGALGPEVPEVGNAFQARRDISINSGRVYRAATVVLEMERLLKHLPRNPTVVLIGAAGGLADLLYPVVQALPGLKNLTVQQEAVPQKLREADLLVVLDDLPGVRIRSEHLRYNAMVLNVVRSRMLDPRIHQDRSDVIFTDPGVYHPAIRIQGTPGFSNTLCPSLMETILLAMDGHQGHFGLGNPTTAQVQYLLSLLKKQPRLQFGFVPHRQRMARPEQLPNHTRWI